MTPAMIFAGAMIIAAVHFSAKMTAVLIVSVVAFALHKSTQADREKWALPVGILVGFAVALKLAWRYLR